MSTREKTHHEYWMNKQTPLDTEICDEKCMNKGSERLGMKKLTSVCSSELLREEGKKNL